MRITLKLNKTINENTNLFFDKTKKLKKKIPGLNKAIEETKNKINDMISQKDEYINSRDEKHKLKIHIKTEWFHKFRWTKTSGDYLCVFGKDSGTNEILIKKHMESNDIVLHTEEPGSPFCLIKGGRDKVNDTDIFEAAQYLGCFSKQWKSNFGECDVFWIFPEQLSKKALSGEYLIKGSFMVEGKKNMLKKVPMRICIGVIKNIIKTDEDEELIYEELFSGSEAACKKFCGTRYLKLDKGSGTYKFLTKEIKKRLKVHIDDLPHYIPNGCKILKR